MIIQESYGGCKFLVTNVTQYDIHQFGRWVNTTSFSNSFEELVFKLRDEIIWIISCDNTRATEAIIQYLQHQGHEIRIQDNKRRY